MAPSTLFRSEEMSLIQLYIPAEVAQPCVAELGELGKVQFRDVSQKIRRLDEMERQCRFLQTQLQKNDIQVRPLTAAAYRSRARSAQEVDDLEENLKEYENRISQLNSSHETLQRRYLQLTELRHVLRESSVFFQQVNYREDNKTMRNSLDEQDDSAPLLENDVEQVHYDLDNMHLGYVTGVIARSRMQTFERVLWRSLRGNLYMKSAEIDEPIVDPDTDSVIDKTSFIIAKIKKISESLGGTLYSIDDSADKRRDSLLDVTSRIEDLNNVLSTTNQTRRSELLKISENVAAWTTIDATDASGTSLPSILTELQTKKTPPTYHRTNKFTEGFQSIIDAYGIARYREVNPGLFTIISFPFLFAMMFGDIGHGAIMFLIALYLCLNEKKLSNQTGEIFSMFFSGRYMMLMMGLFSIFTGAIYNDVFSLSLNIFKSGFDMPSNYTSTETVEALPNGNVYAFGLDPAWHGSENFLLFTNSYKMKQAIIIGVIHMSFAVCLNVFNHIYYKRKAFVWLEFLPQILFLESIFGYLIFCIMYKWSVNWWELDSEGHHIRNAPPNLLNMLIYMFLTPGTVNPEEQLYPGQGPVQLVLILLAVVCVPWMWFAKPFYLKKEASKHHYETIAADDHMDEEHAAQASAEEDEEEEEFDFSEVMIHQTIHTIEFCLNCISNTASYLRLWALSLAHAQLSSVLWDMTLKIWFGFTGPLAVIGLFIGFSMWFVLTLAILLCMEGLSAFLHALRLMWVEFDGKFYNGDGIKFEPFTFVTVLNPTSE
ncbi:V-type ATPase, V0 complex, 116kDa subunit family [Choanephora cucurbitarum]|nr:V-type ATPase, V0 complex, 116kDa subunit family [Choanephora cucurbitarum]